MSTGTKTSDLERRIKELESQVELLKDSDDHIKMLENKTLIAQGKRIKELEEELESYVSYHKSRL